jgi:hypothetical protein
MKRRIWAGALLIAAIAPWSVAQANGVAVSVSTPGFGFQIGAPFYGPPVYPVPVYVPPPRFYVPAPVYAPPPVFVQPRYVVGPRVIHAPYPVVYQRPYRHDVRHVNWNGNQRYGKPHRGRGHGRDD